MSTPRTGRSPALAAAALARGGTAADSATVAPLGHDLALTELAIR
jgi:hypothetical protein